MNLRCIFSRHSVRLFSRWSSGYKTIVSSSPTFNLIGAYHGLPSLNPKFDKPSSRYFHTHEQVNPAESLGEVEIEDESQNDAAMNEFLSRFVWLMRKELSEAYPDCDKQTINGMLVVIVENVVSDSSNSLAEEFSEDLARTVREVSQAVVEDMKKEKRKERLKGYLQSEEVKEMYRFAGQVGIRGDMLRELRFKWAREEMGKDDFYARLERMVKRGAERKFGEEAFGGEERVRDDESSVAEDEKKPVSLPKRHGKLKYKIYGLDLSDSKWSEVADKIHESDEVMWPQEQKPISGKCKIVSDSILSLGNEDDPVPLLGEWKDLLQPSRIDWIAFLDKLKGQNPQLYFKVAEFLLSEESFQANTCDYSKLMEALAEESRFEDVERILLKMNENNIQPDAITLVTLTKIYCKSGNLDRAKEAFKSLRALGYRPDVKVYNYMIMASVKSGNPKGGEEYLREMETMDLKPTHEIYMALLQSFCQAGNIEYAFRIFNTMQFYEGSSSDVESLALMVEACTRAGRRDQAMNFFDQIMKQGHKPDDKTTASMIAAYEKENVLDEALDLLLQLEKKGFEPGVATYTVLVDWLSKLELFDEAEQVLDKISELGEAPPFKLQISLFDMHIKSGAKNKALQALGVLESKIDQLEHDDFERIIRSLIDGHLLQDAQRLHGLMEARGFVLSPMLKVPLMAKQAIGGSKKPSLARDN